VDIGSLLGATKAWRAAANQPRAFGATPAASPRDIRILRTARRAARATFAAGLLPCGNVDLVRLGALEGAERVRYALGVSYQTAYVMGLLSAAGEIAFTVADANAVDDAHADWSRRGLKIAQAPTQMDFGRTFVALDPDGHRLRVFAPGAA
jgi:hypothetical protein